MDSFSSTNGPGEKLLAVLASWRDEQWNSNLSMHRPAFATLRPLGMAPIRTSFSIAVRFTNSYSCLPHEDSDTFSDS